MGPRRVTAKIRRRGGPTEHHESIAESVIRAVFRGALAAGERYNPQCRSAIEKPFTIAYGDQTTFTERPLILVEWRAER